MRLSGERTFEVYAAAPTTVVWALIARPQSWHRWAPHVRGAWGLGEPEVREGARGAARLLGVAPVPATVLAVEPGRSWTWKAGPVRLDHTVLPAADPAHCRVVFTLRGPTPVVRAYGPAVLLLMHNLARVASRSAASTPG